MKKTLCAMAPMFAVGIACAGSVEGEVDGTSLPPLLSGIWLESDAGDLVNVSASATSMLDTCGTMIRLLEAQTAAIEEIASDVDDGDDLADVLEDVYKKLDEVDATILPEDFWTVTVSMLAEDTDEMKGGSFDQDDFGKEGGMVVVVCHQEGFPDRDRETGIDDNATCFVSAEATADVGNFEKKGGIELTAEAELVAADDLDDDVGDVTLTIRGSPCPKLEDRKEDLNEALEELFENLDQLSEDEEDDGPGSPSCSFDDQCFANHQLCDSEFGECATPESVTANCEAADFFFSGDLDGPLLFDATLEPSFADCEFPFLFTASFHDAEGDFDPGASDITGRDVFGSSLFFQTLSVEGAATTDGAIAVIFCADDEFPEVAFQVRDRAFNDSNPACAE